jgi:hypothetical protein
MKKSTIVIAFIGVAALLATIALPGCATPTVTAVPVVTTVPVGTLVPVVTTISVTGSNGVVVVSLSTNLIATTNPTTVTNIAYVTNYAPNPTLMQISSSAGAIAPVVTTSVPGYGAMAGLIIGLIGIVAGGVGSGIAVYKNGVANKNQSTLQAVISGVENAFPAIQQALTTTTASGVLPANLQSAALQAQAALGAVKGSITQATNANGTAPNLTTVAATVGAGPLAA